MALEIMPRTWGFGMRPLFRDADNLWNSFFGDTGLTNQEMEWTPSVDISETDGMVQLKAELPGMEAKDIDIDVTEDVLTLRGIKKMEEEQKDERYYRRERCAGSFMRSFRLPSRVVSDKVNAEFKNGVLNILIPKSEESKHKKIKIKEM